jgi:DNA processing protein
MNNEIILQLVLTKGIGNVTLKKVLNLMEADKSLGWNNILDKSILQDCLGFNKDIIHSIYKQKERAKRLSEKLYEKGIVILLENDVRYPFKLKALQKEKCPAILFVQGNLEILNKKSVGFCGSRKVSQKGIDITSNCAKQLAQNNVVVVSGYAAGTDLAAHKGALQYSGETVFVLAEGLLRSRFKKGIKELLTGSNHVFVSQFVPEVTWKSFNAMKRNGIIIGLSDAMILVESGKKGGTFAAGEETLSVRHPLFVIDFAQPEVSAEANPYFISRGGIPIRGKSGIPNLGKVFDLINKRDFTTEPEQLSLGISTNKYYN